MAVKSTRLGFSVKFFFGAGQAAEASRPAASAPSCSSTTTRCWACRRTWPAWPSPCRCCSTRNRPHRRQRVGPLAGAARAAPSLPLRLRPAPGTELLPALRPLGVHRRRRPSGPVRLDAGHHHPHARHHDPLPRPAHGLGRGALRRLRRAHRAGGHSPLLRRPRLHRRVRLGVRPLLLPVGRVSERPKPIPRPIRPSRWS